MVTSPLGNVGWPEIKMPKFEFSPPWRRSEHGKGGWLSAPIAKVRSTTHSAMERTRTAWNSAVDRMKFALPGRVSDLENSEPRVAEADPPSFWERMLGPREGAPEKDDVVEMMARQPDTIQR